MDKELLIKFHSIVDTISLCINNKFRKIQEACKEYNPEMSYRVYLFDECDLCVASLPLYYNKDEKQYLVEFSYEGGNIVNSLPCKYYENSIKGMTVEDVKDYYRAYCAKIGTFTKDGFLILDEVIF